MSAVCLLGTAGLLLRCKSRTKRSKVSQINYIEAIIKRSCAFCGLLTSVLICGCKSVEVSAHIENQSALPGRTFCVQGDSISASYGNAWQMIVQQRTGMILAGQNARSGRTFAQAFEIYGTTTPGTALKVNQGSVETSTGSFRAGTAGNAISQDIAGCEVMLIELGTNDYHVPIGNLGDPTTAGTFYGNVRWVDEAYLSANPKMRIVHISPQYRKNVRPATTMQYVNALIAYGNSMGIPVINMFALGGVNEKTVAALTRDGTHPSDYGYSHFYGPVIAQGLLQVY